jgi:hypothetical protein
MGSVFGVNGIGPRIITFSCLYTHFGLHLVLQGSELKRELDTEINALNAMFVEIVT